MEYQSYHQVQTFARTRFVTRGLSERRIRQVNADGRKALGGDSKHAVLAQIPTLVASEVRLTKRAFKISHALALPLVDFTALRAARLLRLRLRACKRKLFRPVLLVKSKLIKCVEKPLTLLVDAMI